MLSPARHARAFTPANRRGVERQLDEFVRSPHLVALRDTGSVHVRRPVYGLASRPCAGRARPRIGAFPCGAQWRMPTHELLAYRCEGSVGIGSHERETHRLPVSSRSTDVLRDTSKRCGRLQCPRGESTGAARPGQALTIAIHAIGSGSTFEKRMVRHPPGNHNLACGIRSGHACDAPSAMRRNARHDKVDGGTPLRPGA